MKNINKTYITTLVLLFISALLAFFIFKSIISFTVLLSISLTIVYLNGYYKYVFFRNHKSKVTLEARKLLKIFYVNDVKFSKKEKIEKMDYIVVFSMVFMMSMAFLYTVVAVCDKLRIYNIINDSQYKSIKGSAFLSVVLLVIFFICDFQRIFKLIFNSKIIFIEASYFNIQPIPITDINCKLHHKNILIMEHNYKNYSLIDLKREKFLLEGRLERAKKPAFYDTYILPLVVTFVTGILAIVSSYINTFMFSKGNENNLGDALISYIFIAFILLSFVMWISFMIRKVSYDSIEDLRSRILVIDEMILSMKSDGRTQKYTTK